jgi:hypothetical protein
MEGSSGRDQADRQRAPRLSHGVTLPNPVNRSDLDQLAFLDEAYHRAMMDGEPQRKRDEQLYRNVDHFLDDQGLSPDLMRDTLWRMIDINREITRIQKRAGLMIVGAALVFELLNRRFIGEASFAGIKLSRLDFLRALAPLAISYFFLRFVVLTRDFCIYRAIVERITSKAFPGLYRSDLDRMLPYGYLGGVTVNWLPVSYAYHLRRSWVVAAMAEFFVSILAPLTFLVYAYWQLFSSNRTDSLSWFSLFGTVIFLISSVVLGVAVARTVRGLPLKEWSDLSALRPGRPAPKQFVK